jgi:hypothetical protein
MRSAGEGSGRSHIVIDQGGMTPIVQAGAFVAIIAIAAVLLYFMFEFGGHLMGRISGRRNKGLF